MPMSNTALKKISHAGDGHLTATTPLKTTLVASGKIKGKTIKKGARKTAVSKLCRMRRWDILQYHNHKR